jgi:SAM-dependent methyltransferase
VLDVGLGRGVQALRLARYGHDVTGLEADPDLRELVEKRLADEPEGIRRRVTVVPGGSEEAGVHFTPGAFDLVLCHGELMAARDPGTTLAGLARVLDAGGLLSLLVRNEDAPAMQPARAGDWEAALAALDYPERAGRALRLSTLTSTLAGIGTPLRQWYGVRVFGTDESDDAGGEEPWGADESGEPGGDGEGSEAERRMLAAEERAASVDPYRAAAAMLHLCGVRRS